MIAFTTMSALTNMPHGDRSRGNVPAPTETVFEVEGGSVLLGTCVPGPPGAAAADDGCAVGAGAASGVTAAGGVATGAEAAGVD